MRQINSIVIHCSDSDIPGHDDISVIREWHTKERGWSDVGYHFFVKSNGEIQKGRPTYKVGAHCRGMNANSIGICLHGRDEFSNDQFKALSDLVSSLLVEHDILVTQVYGHYHFSNKTCPNFNVSEFIFEWL
jgi:N-acetyl-anhydromuramyl-L-alanine amidase AmpD